MKFPTFTAALVPWLPSPESLLKAAWVATVVPLAAFGYLTWKSVGLKTEVTSLESQRQELTKEVDALKTLRHNTLVDLQSGKLEAAEDRLLEAADVASTSTPPSSDDPTRRQLVVQLFDPDPSVRVNAYGGLLPRYKDDESLVPELLDVARQNPRNANGIYNTLVVLSHMDRNTLRTRAEEIRTFAQAQVTAGPRIKVRAETLLRRLPPASQTPPSSLRSMKKEASQI